MKKQFIIIGDTYYAQDAIKYNFPGAVFDRAKKAWKIESDEETVLEFIKRQTRHKLVALDMKNNPVDKHVTKVLLHGDTKPVYQDIKRMWGKDAVFWPKVHFQNDTVPGWTIGYLDKDERKKAIQFAKSKGLNLAVKINGIWKPVYTAPDKVVSQGPGPSHKKDEFVWYEGEGYGGHSLKPGTVIQTPYSFKEKGPWSIVVKEIRPQYFREDGMSIGVGADQGYLYGHVLRLATPEESLPMRLKVEKVKFQQETRIALRKLVSDIQKKGKRPFNPDGSYQTLTGEILKDPSNFRDGWFVFQPGAIWYVQDNGNDGDDWSYNNVTTGGAGAIGWKIHRDKDLEEAIREYVKILNS